MFYVVGYPVSPALSQEGPRYSILEAENIESLLSVPEPTTGYLPMPIFPPFELEIDAIGALKNLEVNPYSPLHPWMGVVGPDENVAGVGYVPS